MKAVLNKNATYPLALLQVTCPSIVHGTSEPAQSLVLGNLLHRNKNQFQLNIHSRQNILISMTEENHLSGNGSLETLLSILKNPSSFCFILKRILVDFWGN